MYKNINLKEYSCEVRKEIIDSWSVPICESWGTGNNNGTKYDKCLEWGTAERSKTYYEWLDVPCFEYNFPIKEYTYFKLKGNIEHHSKVEWIPKLYSYYLDAWAWWNSSYTNRTTINESDSDINIAVSVNGTYGIAGNIVWFNPSNLTGLSYVYHDSGYSSWAIADDNTEDVYDSEVISYNNSATDVYNDNASVVLHFANNGTAEDSTSNNNDFIVYGATWGAEVFGDGYTCDGTNDYFNTTFDLKSIIDGEFSLNLWVKTTDTDADQVLYGVYRSGGGEEYVYMPIMNSGGTAGKIQFDIGDGTATASAFVTNTTIHDGNWHMLTFTKFNDSENSFKVYIDGDEQTLTRAGDQTTSSGWDNVINGYICARNLNNADGLNYAADIDEFRIYDLELTAQQINTLYNSSQNVNYMLGDEDYTALVLTLGDVNDSVYRGQDLQPDVTVVSSGTVDILLYLIDNATSTFNTILNTTEAAGTYTNTSITIDTNYYIDGFYYLNLSANISSLSDATTSNSFLIDNIDLNISGVTSGASYHDSDLQPDIWANVTNDYTLTLYLVDGSDSWELYSWSNSGGYYSNTSLSIDTTVYNDSATYYLELNVTTNTSISEINITSNFSIDNSAPTITFNWDIENDWYSSLNHSVNFTVTDSFDASILCNITYNTQNYYDNYTNNTLYHPATNIINGVNTFNATCYDDTNNSVSINENTQASYTQINIKEEENREDFDIANFSAVMLVSANSTRNITYDNTNSSQMLNWYFYILNDTIRDVRLAIETVYYRSQTDMQNVTNLTFYMYNDSFHTSSQILLKIDTVGYDKPIVVKRPRSTGEDLITEEYPVGVDREVNAYLIDSRLYNIYSYDSNNNLEYITNLMVSGARTIHLSTSVTQTSFVSRGTFFAHFVSTKQSNGENYTLSATADGDVAYDIDIYNYTGDIVASGSYGAGRNTLEYEVNKTNLNVTVFTAWFTYADGTVLKRQLTLGSPAIVFPTFEFWDIGGGNVVLVSIGVLLLCLAIAGMFASYSMEFGLIIGAGLMALFYWAAELHGSLLIIAQIMALAGAIILIVNRIRGN